MTGGFSNPLVGGGGALVYPSIHSPNFVPGISGWSIDRSGIADFFDAFITGVVSTTNLDVSGQAGFGTSAPDELIILAPSGDSTGVTDAANISNAFSSAKMVLLLPGIWYLNSNPVPKGSGYYLLGCGRWATIVVWQGSGDCFRFYDDSTYTARTVHGGGIAGLTIKAGGSYSSPSTGLRVGDILGFRFDVTVTGFGGSGDIGVHLDNEYYWTEQAIGIAYVNGCTQSVVFDVGTSAGTSTGSFDRGDFTFYLSQTVVGKDVITWQNGAQQVGGMVRAYGNINSSATPFTAAIFKFTGSTPAGHSPATNSGLECGIDWNVESDLGLAHTYQTVNFGSTSNLINECWGSMNFGDAFAFQASNASVPAQHIFQGPVVGDSVLGQQTIINRMAVNSQQFWFSHISSESSGGTASPTAAAGAEASSVTVGSRSSDTAGTLTITTTGSPSAGTLAVVTFHTPYTNMPTILVVPADANSAACGPYVTSGTASGFDVNCSSAPGSSVTLVVNYFVIGQDS